MKKLTEAKLLAYLNEKTEGLTITHNQGSSILVSRDDTDVTLQFDYVLTGDDYLDSLVVGCYYEPTASDFRNVIETDGHVYYKASQVVTMGLKNFEVCVKTVEKIQKLNKAGRDFGDVIDESEFNSITGHILY